MVDIEGIIGEICQCRNMNCSSCKHWADKIRTALRDAMPKKKTDDDLSLIDPNTDRILFHGYNQAITEVLEILGSEKNGKV